MDTHKGIEKYMLLVLIAVNTILKSNIDLVIMFFISSQEREISVPILSCSVVPRSCKKFAFLRARGPNMPGSREHETINVPISVYEY